MSVRCWHAEAHRACSACRAEWERDARHARRAGIPGGLESLPLLPRSLEGWASLIRLALRRWA